MEVNTDLDLVHSVKRKSLKIQMGLKLKVPRTSEAQFLVQDGRKCKLILLSSTATATYL